MDDPHEATPYTTTADLDAPPDQVWEALTDGDGVEAWLGEGSTIEVIDGGTLDASDPETGIIRRGRIDEVEPERRLAYTWWPTDDPHQRSTVTIELIPTGAGTRLVITERPMAPTASARVDQGRTAWVWRAASLELRLLSATIVAST
jgi:uncharacterized protein YndB with AHSA1/START domain